MKKYYCECLDETCKKIMNTDKGAWEYYKSKFFNGLMLDRKIHENNIPKGYKEVLHCPDTIIIVKL